MVATYPTFGSYILFKNVLEDELGNIYRAGELAGGALSRTAWLRTFDGPGVARDEVAKAIADANRIGELLQAANVAGRPRFTLHEGVPACAWDHTPGQPLSAVLRKVREEGFPVPVDNALLILEKISLALSAGLAVDVGGSPLVHGCVHPGMVIVTNDGEAAVAGFGVGDALLGLLEDPASRRNCAPYLSPEVLTTHTASRCSDVYSMGAILYHLLTGEPLPEDPAVRQEALVSAHMAFDEAPIPKDISALLVRCLADRPEERFSSAADFKKELDKLLYGGAYSPTTFNLALFMDRLFRAEIETDEKERLAEAQLDVTPYLAPEPEPEEESEEALAAGGGRGLWIGLAAAAVVVAAVVGYLMFGRGPSTPVTPTPSPEQVLAQRQAQQKQVEALVQQQVAQLMAEREAQIRTELLGRQKEIDRLQQRLKQVERSPSSGQQAQQKRQEIQRQIAAAEEAKRQQEAALEAERQKALAEAKRRLAQATPTLAPTVAVAVPTAGQPAVAPPTRAQATAIPPTSTPAPVAPQPTTAAAAAQAQVKFNDFVDPTLVDSQPVVLKTEPVVWPRTAVRSRRRGVVILSATVDGRGRVVDVKVLRADETKFGIPQAAIEAARKYAFKPATKGGVRVTSTATVTVPYAFRPR